ncbi:MAG: antirestriction protein ArdA [Bdellovibrionales bacterium]
MNTIRIYVACLASYNAGTLFGKWIDANQSAEEIHADISAMLRGSPEAGAEEWAVHDYEGFGEISLREWPDISRVSVIARLLEEHGDAFSLWYTSQAGQNVDLEEVEEKFLEQWQGAHDSKEAFADYLLDTTGQLSEMPEFARRYFNFEAFARDLELSGDYSFVRANGQVYAFSSH